MKMRMKIPAALSWFTVVAPALAFALQRSITPHDQYSSSIGALGCKINTNRVAYWPDPVDCDNLCVQVSHGGRSLHLLHVDQSGGAYDISYDAWNYLGFGSSAQTSPRLGGGIDMCVEYVSMDNCQDLLDGGYLPLSAANGMDNLSRCLADTNSWVARNYKLYNIREPICATGHDEVCELDLSRSNQPTCLNTLGGGGELKGLRVVNIEYGTGRAVTAP